MRFPAIVVLACVLACTGQASAEVTRIEVTRRDDVGTHQRLIGKVYFSIDPADKANSQIADVMLAPRNAEGRVEFSGDLLFFQPKDVATANGTVFFEVVNRGRDQSLPRPSGAATVLVHYEGKLADGSVFDSSFARGEPAEFPLGAVVAGFSEAIQQMRPGDEVVATFPMELGYGPSGRPPVIPPAAPLQFRIVLLAFQEPGAQPVSAPR